jgi:hypothetical protein
MSGRLLVLTDSAHGGRNGLAMPFRDATVIALEPGDITRIEGEFDNAVIDRTPTDVASLDCAMSSATRALRRDGHLIVMLPAMQPSPQNEADPPALGGLVWRGLATLNNRPCAVLSCRAATDSSADAWPLLAAADLACRLASPPTCDGAGHTPNARGVASPRQMEDRGSAEQALLREVDTLRNELEAERRRHRGLALVSTVLTRRRPGRAMVGAVRKCRRLASRLAGRR